MRRDPRRVRLVRVAGMPGSPITIWDVYTRQTGVHLGEVRRYDTDPRSNRYGAWTRREWIGFHRTRSLAVEALIDSARADLAEAIS